MDDPVASPQHLLLHGKFEKTGCDRWVQALEHPIFIVDDLRNRWLTTDHMTVLNLLAGTLFPVKVHSTTHSNL